MQRRIADISTRFRVEGLGSAQREIARFTRDIGRQLRDANVQRQLGFGPSSADMKAFDRAKAEVLNYEQWWGEQLRKQEQVAARAAERAAATEAKAKEAAAKKAAADARVIAKEEERAQAERTAANARERAAEEKRLAAELARIKQSQDAEYTAWWKRQLDEQANAAKLAEKAKATEAKNTERAAREAAAEARRIAREDARAQAQRERDNARDRLAEEKRVAAEVARVKKAEDEDYVSWWKSQLDEQADAERRIEDELLDQKRGEREEYARWWKQQLDEIADKERQAAEEAKRQLQEEEAARKAAARAQASRARELGQIGSEIRAAFSLDGIGEGIRGIVDRIQGVAEVVGTVSAAAGTVVGTVAATGRAFVAMGAAGVKASRLVIGTLTTVAARVRDVTMGIVAATARLTAMGTAAAVAAGGATAAFVRGAANDSQTFIQKQEQVANTLGMSIEEFSRFAGMAERSSLAIEDVRQAMTQFLGIAGQAAEGGNQYSKIFERLGIRLTDTQGKVRPFLELLQDFANASVKLGRGERAALLTQVFGDDDATKVGRLLDQMGKNLDTADKMKGDGAERVISFPGLEREKDETDKLAEARKRLIRTGAVVTDKDLALSKQYKETVVELKQSFIGLRLAVWRTFAPAIMNWVRLFSKLLQDHRGQIVERLVNAYNRFIVILRDFLKVFFDLNTGYDVQHRWMITLWKRYFDFRIMIKELIPIFFDLISVLWSGAKALNAMIGAATGQSPVDWVKNLRVVEMVQAIRFMRLVLLDFYSVLSGRNTGFSTEIGYTMAAWKVWVLMTAKDLIAQIQGYIAKIPAMIASVMAYALPIIQSIGNTILDIVTGLVTADLSSTTTALGKVAVYLRLAAEYAFGLVKAILDLTVLNQEVDPTFAWVQKVGVWIMWLTKTVSWAIERVQWFYDLMEALSQLFLGVPFAVAALAAWLIRLTGVFQALGTMAGWAAGIMGLSGAVSAAGAAFSASITAAGGWAALGGMTLPAAFAALKAAIAAAMPVIWAAIAPFAMWVAVIGALILAFMFLPKAIAAALEAITGTTAKMNAEISRTETTIRQNEEAWRQDRIKRGFGDPLAGIEEARRNLGQGQGWDRINAIKDTLANIGPGQGAGMPGIDSIYNFKFANGQDAQLFGNSDELQALLNSGQFSRL